MSKKHFCLMLLVCMGMLFGVQQTVSAQGAQKQKVTGTIVDANGEPIIGASILVKGSSTGTVTDLDGNFTLDNVPANGSLVVSYVGFASQTVNVNGKSSLNITLEEDRSQALSLDSVNGKDQRPEAQHNCHGNGQ